MTKSDFSFSSFAGQLFFGDYHTATTATEQNKISHGGLGGHGGGALILKTRHAFVDGIISANGQDAAKQSNAGGGSGGSIHMTCDDLVGFGMFQANGGNGSQGGGGAGGGRIALEYTENHKFNGNFIARGGDSAEETGGTSQKIQT